MRPQFVANRKLHRRATKISALNSAATPEAREARKAMNEVNYGKARVNLNGFFGEQRVRGKEKRKCRKIRSSKPFMAAVKAGY